MMHKICHLLLHTRLLHPRGLRLIHSMLAPDLKNKLTPPIIKYIPITLIGPSYIDKIDDWTMFVGSGGFIGFNEMKS